MSQGNLSLSSYQLRIALRRTSPHVWRRVLVPCHGTLLQLHQTLRALFGWSEAYPHRFLIRGKSFTADQTSECEGTGPIQLSDFQFYLRERFFYDYQFELQTPVWRLEIRVEKMLPVQEKWRYPRCIAGAGSPPPEPVASPQEFHHMLLKICHRLAPSTASVRRRHGTRLACSIAVAFTCSRTPANWLLIRCFPRLDICRVARLARIAN
ncbi:MAG: plasmid pRiA4b ORF-3 family protein [Bryobacteraceae bacterium]